MAVLTKAIPEWKTKQVNEIANEMSNAHTVAIVDIKGMPGSQFHDLRGKLRKHFDIKVLRKVVLEHAIDKAVHSKKGIEELKNNLGEMPALIVSKNLSPFSISKLLKENKAPDFAKPGNIAPKDIEVEEGPTPFTPGPMLSELKEVGLTVKVEAGKIVVMKKSVIVKAGDPIKDKVADILMKLSIRPMEIGLGLAGAWENGFIFKRDVLDFDVGKYLSDFETAARNAFHLSIGIAYPTKENISALLGKAHREAKALGEEKGLLGESNKTGEQPAS